MKKFLKNSKCCIAAILTLCLLLGITGTCVNVTAMAAETTETVEETAVATEEITIATAESTGTTEETTVAPNEHAQELVPMMARACGENRYPLTNGYYGTPGISGGSMRVMEGGFLGACDFFTYLTGQDSVV